MAYFLHIVFSVHSQTAEAVPNFWF